MNPSVHLPSSRNLVVLCGWRVRSCRGCGGMVTMFSVGRIQFRASSANKLFQNGFKWTVLYRKSEQRCMHLFATAVCDRPGYIGNERKITLRQRPLLTGLRTHHPHKRLSTLADILPNFSYSIWGASGYLLKTLHHDGLIPFWACMSLTNILVRTSLIPVVIKAAHTSARLANVAPEVQFLVSSFQNDYKRLKDQGAGMRERRFLFRVSWQTLRKIYQLHKVNPLDVFKSPLIQIPIFWYFSVDIRKIINGFDPELAQQLTESSFLWITDLTDPDPWHGLPILTGLLLYLNVEIAVGRRSLSGESVVKSKIGIYLKDFFQSLAIFMPCFMSQSPSGVQIYLLTSFVFTLGQAAALRYDPLRAKLGLPLMSDPPPEAKIAKQFIELKELERKAIEARGDGELLGRGVLAPGFQASFAGTMRPSSIQIQPHVGYIIKEKLNFSVSNEPVPTPLIRTPPKIVLDSAPSSSSPVIQSEPAVTYLAKIPENIIDSANRGERPIEYAPESPKKDLKLSSKQFLKKTTRREKRK